jgi:hypothetical protein
MLSPAPQAEKTHQLREDSPRDRMHLANHTSADGLHSVWIARRDAISANAKIRTQLKLPAVGFLKWRWHGAGQKTDEGADEMFDYLGTAPEEAGEPKNWDQEIKLKPF